MLSDEAKASIAEAERQRAVWEGKKPLIDSRFGARTIGDMALIDVGCSIWSKEDDLDARMDSAGNARGGIVVEVHDVTDFTDDGEIVKSRAFRTFDYYLSVDDPRAQCVLLEASVDLERCEPVNVGKCRGLMRKMCAHVGRQRGQAHKPEIDLAVYASRLAALVGQRGY